MPIPPAATAIHGITDDDVADRLPFRAIARRLARLLYGYHLAGFGIRRFDLPSLRAEFERAGMEFRVQGRVALDALDIFHRREPRDLASALRFYCGQEHNTPRATHDVRAPVTVLDAQLARYRDLPRSVAGLHRWPVGVDVAGRFHREGGRVVPARGQAPGPASGGGGPRRPPSLRWMLRPNLLDDAQALARRALQAVGG